MSNKPIVNSKTTRKKKTITKFKDFFPFNYLFGY